MTSIMNEIDLMHKFNSPFIVNFYGAFVSNDHEVNILMEHMNCGCLCNTIKHVGRIDNEVMLGKVAEATILGLKYVWDTHKVRLRGSLYEFALVAYISAEPHPGRRNITYCF